MRTKKNIIEDLIAFAVSIRTDKSIDSDVNGVTAIVCSPEDTGASRDAWHSLINYYDDQISALDRFANTACTNSTVITRQEGECDDQFIDRVSQEITEFATRF
jgi:hypothetical protein